MNLFERMVATAMKDNATMNPLVMVVEKELLHHDILREMSGAGLLERLTFMGGTCLRACYGSQRLSEDLDFTGGSDFNKECLSALPPLLTGKLFKKYGFKVEVSEPKRENGNVDTWKLKVVTRPEQRGMPIQRINIDICAVPSYDTRPMMLHNYYGVDMGTSGLIIQVESREEILADKLIALALRPGRIKNRDLWDIVWLTQQNVHLPMELVRQKIHDHRRNPPDYLELLAKRRELLRNDVSARTDFEGEMRRFLPVNIVKDTIENSLFWEYVVNSVVTVCDQVVGTLTETISVPQFNMGQA